MARLKTHLDHLNAAFLAPARGGDGVIGAARERGAVDVVPLALCTGCIDGCGVLPLIMFVMEIAKLADRWKK